MIKKLIFTLCCLVTFSQVNAQLVIKLGDDSAYVKKIEQQFATATNDSVKAYTALRLSYIHKRQKDTEKVNYYLGQGIKFAKGNAFLEAATHYYTAFSMLGEPDKDRTTIETHLRTADSLLQHFNLPEAYRIRGNSWVVLGTLEQMKGDEEKALHAYLTHALPLAEKSSDQFLIANVNKFIGIVFLNAEERDKAAGYLTRALASFEVSSFDEYPNKQEAILETTLIIAENSIYRNKLDTAKIHLDNAQKVLQLYPESNLHLFYYYPEGVYYDRMGQYGKAINSFDKGISFGGGAENYYVNRMKYGKFECLLKMRHYAAAIRVMQELLKSPILLPLDKRVYMKKLAEAYAKTGNLKEAYSWSEKYTIFSDSLKEADYEANLIKLEKKYEVTQKENQIITLEAEKRASEYSAQTARLNSLLWAIGCILLLVAAGFLFFFLHSSRKLAVQKERNHEQQILDITRQQELKLTKAALAGEEKERQRIGRDLHDGLGGALSGIKIKLSGQQETANTPVLDEIILQLDDSIDELRRIARNMMPETLISAGLKVALQDLCASVATSSVDVEFQSNGIRSGMSVDQQMNIYRIVQELLSNAIRHSKADMVVVQCLQNEGIFLITVEDNGTGFDPTQISSTGIGLTNIRNRVDDMKGRLEIATTEHQGTTVTIALHG